MSVLTDTPYFQGRTPIWSRPRAVSLPLIRKDFHARHLSGDEARALGADCILLIMAALEDAQAAELAAAAHELGYGRPGRGAQRENSTGRWRSRADLSASTTATSRP